MPVGVTAAPKRPACRRVLPGASASLRFWRAAGGKMPLYALLACWSPAPPAPPDPLETVGRAPLSFYDAQAGDHPLSEHRPRLSDAALDPDEDPALSAFLWEEGAITDLALSIDGADMARLEADPDVDVPATLLHEGESWLVGVRLKGNMTRRGFSGKPSLKIDVHEFRPDQRFFGLRRLTLNNMVQDKSMLKEHVAYRLYRDLGVPAPRHGYVRLTVNDEPYGLYGLVESMDQQFIDGWWPDDDEGNLYEGGYGGDLLDGRDDDFELQEDGEIAAPTDLVELIEALEAATPETMDETLAARFDLAPVLDAIAVDLVSGNWDAYARAANNFLLYHAPEADRWHLVPWGQDQAFTDRYVPVHAGWEGRILILCGRSAACTQRLYTHVEGVLAAWVDLPAYAADVAATIAADCEGDPRAEIPCSPDDVLGFLEERPAIVREELDGGAATD